LLQLIDSLLKTSASTKNKILWEEILGIGLKTILFLIVDVFNKLETASQLCS
jgi:hypothetical protein